MNPTKVILAVVLTVAVLMLTAFLVDSRKERRKVELFPATAVQPVKEGSKPMTKAKAPAPTRTIEAPRYRPPTASEEVRHKADEVIRRHAGMSRDQMMRSQELHGFMERTIALMNTPAMMEKIQKAVAQVQAVTGVESESMTLDYFDKLDDARGRAWVEAAVSEDPGQMENWIINRFNGSIFEFALDPNLPKTTDGLSIAPDKPATEPPPPKLEE